MKQKTFEWSLERGDLLPLLLLLPTLLVIILIIVLPLFYGLFLSFFNIRLGGKSSVDSFVGLSNYLQFFRDPTALKATVNTVLFSFGAIAGDFFLGTLIALGLLRLKNLTSWIVRTVVMMPLLISPVVVGLIWRYIYDPKGILYWFLGKFGIGTAQFPGVTAASTSLLSTIIAHTWAVTPFVVIVLTAGLLSIPEEYYEASKIDGAGPFRTFFQITLPQLTNVYIVILLVSGVDTIKVFDIIYALTGGGPNNSTISLSMYAYSQAYDQSNLSYSIAVSMLTMLLTFCIFGIPFIKHNLAKGNR